MKRKPVLTDEEILKNIGMFDECEIRTIWNPATKKFYFSATDVIQALTDTKYPSDYLKKMRKYNASLKADWDMMITKNLFLTKGGTQPLNCIDTGGVLRLIQESHSPRVKIFIRWMQLVSKDILSKADQKTNGISKDAKVTHLTEIILKTSKGITPTKSE